MSRSDKVFLWIAVPPIGFVALMNVYLWSLLGTVALFG